MRKILSVFTLIAILLVGVVTTNAQSNGIRTGQTRTGSYVIMLQEMAVPYDVSNNGQHVVIQSFEAGLSYYWSATGGLDTLFGLAYSVSDDGKVAGTFNYNGLNTAGYWLPSTQTWTALPINPAFPTNGLPDEYNGMWCMNNSGDKYVVMHIDENYVSYPYTYTVDNGFQALPCTPYPGGGRGNAISDDGNIIAGFVVTESGFWAPAFWNNYQLHAMNDLSGEATAVSANGRYVAGYAEAIPATQAFVYDRVTETTFYVPDMSGSADGLHATCVTNDGDVFGFINSFPPFFRTAFACVRGTYLSFSDYLLMRGFTDAVNWTIQSVYSVTADGNTFIGAASIGEEAFSFIISLEPLPECGAPENLTATIDEDVYTTINLNWDAPADPIGVTYDIYTSILDSVPFATGVTTTSYSIPDNEPGQRSFIVKAVWPDGCVSVPSNNATVTVYSCPANSMCSLTFVMNDEYGDGWNGASIKIVGEQGDVAIVDYDDQVDQLTVEVPFCSDNLTFEWISGEWDEECTFSILFGDSTIYTSPDVIDETFAGVFFTYELQCPTVDVDIEENLNQNVQIYPNPADNHINVAAKNIEMVSVYNSVGQLVETINANGNQVVVNTAKYNSGIYFVRVVANGTAITQKIIVR